jgi:RNA recognition motif-containing protein
MTIQVDNLPSQVTEQDLKNLLTKYENFVGSISISFAERSAILGVDGKDAEAYENRVIQLLNNTEFYGQKLQASKLEVNNSRDAGGD